MDSQPIQLDLDDLREASRESLYFFAKGILGFDWLTPHIHGPVCDVLQDATINRKLFVLPRGWLKTTLCSNAYPIWRAVHDPNVRTLLAQNNQPNARSKLKVVSSQFKKNSLLRAMYPGVLPGRDSTWATDSLCLTRSGSFPESTFECIGVRGQSVSRHYNIIIEDDTVAPDFDELGEEMLAPSHEDVRKAIGWHQLALPLLTNPETDEIIVVGTRWYEHDLISYIRENEPAYVCMERSCLENEKGESDPRGHVTYPERFSQPVLTQLQNALGPYFFSTLMLNRPVRTGDMSFKAEWINVYQELPRREHLMVYTTVDFATDPELSTSRTSELDYSTVLTTAKDMTTGFIYVVDYFRERCNPGDHAAAIFDHVVKYRPFRVGYENVAYQRSMDYWLKELMRKEQIYFVLEPVKRPGGTGKSKDAYILGLQPLFSSGSVFIQPWMRELRAELLSFPYGTHDDLIDTLAMQLPMWRGTYVADSNEPHVNLEAIYSFEAALEELKKRNRIGRDSPVFDPLRASTTSSFRFPAVG